MKVPRQVPKLRMCEHYNYSTYLTQLTFILPIIGWNQKRKTHRLFSSASQWRGITSKIYPQFCRGPANIIGMIHRTSPNVMSKNSNMEGSSRNNSYDYLNGISLSMFNEPKEMMAQVDIKAWGSMRTKIKTIFRNEISKEYVRLHLKNTIEGLNSRITVVLLILP